MSAFGADHDPGVLGSSPTLGSLLGGGRCFSFSQILPLPTECDLSLKWMNKIFKK